jgi:hypothetical protein
VIYTKIFIKHRIPGASINAFISNSSASTGHSTVSYGTGVGTTIGMTMAVGLTMTGIGRYGGRPYANDYNASGSYEFLDSIFYSLRVI